MPHENQSSETTFGYLSTVQAAEYGYFGGYLIVSALGRPLEFHCTSPVRPSRAQEILYGPALQPYLLGEQIGGKLLGAAKLAPRLIVTDQPAMLTIRAEAGVPMALVTALASRLDRQGTDSIACKDNDPASVRLHELAGTESGDDRLAVGRYELQLAAGFPMDRQAVIEAVEVMSQHIDLNEPFGRIHEAIYEAQRIGGRTLEDHGQAA